MNAWRTQLVSIVLALILGGVYIGTLAPGAVWGDGLEFSTVVHTLGIPHPTGYPLYVMLGKVWEIILPLGTVAWRLNLLSAVFGVVAALLLFGAVREAMPEPRDWEDVPIPHHWRRVMIPAGTALAWGLTPAVWQTANVAEVYTLFAVFLHGLVWMMLRNLRKPMRWGDPLVALVFGLSLTHHRLILVIAPGVLVYFAVRLIRVWRERQRIPILWALTCLLVFVIGLLPILYLPLRSAMGPAINWGNPSTFKGLLWTLRGGEFVNMRFLADAGIPWGDDLWLRIGQRLWLILSLLPGEFVPLIWRTETFAQVTIVVLTILMALGWWRSRLSLRWGLPVVGGLNLAVVTCYSIPDFQSYLIPTISAAWFWIAFGVLWITEWLERLFLRRHFLYTPLVLGLLPLWLGFRFWETCDRSHDERADLWAAGVLEQLEPHALLLTQGDGDIYALWYTQLVDGLRPDVTIFGTNFMWSGWYATFFTPEEREHLHIEDLNRPPDAVYFLNARVGGVIAPNLAAGRPVYSVFNIYESPDHLLLRIWEQRLYGQHRYEIQILSDHTRDPLRPGSNVAPPRSPLLPEGWVEAMRHLQEPSPLLFRIIDNPTLTELARQRFEVEVAPGYAAWRRSQLPGFQGSSPAMPSDQLLRATPR
ncbi:DUF2723 domain-containing protein [Candidatus Sumerlaeota bacterium]|nr:DUF2723 domain-containing protein [Candidatus Sumerlaeota bacterium]